jgi:hypothetical protein
MAGDSRKSVRVNAKVPVRLEDDSRGTTRDVSPSGVYFLADGEIENGQSIRFAIEFADVAGRPLHLTCVGRVVRVEESGGSRGVAVAILESRLERPAVAVARGKRRASAH